MSVGPRPARTALSLVLVAVAVLVGVAALTDGFRAFTSEAARRHSVRNAPRVLPDVVLEDQNGRRLQWRDLTGHPVLVEFVYTSCPDVCQRLLSEFQTLVTGAASEEASNTADLRFLSVSFDSERDTPERLRAVAGFFGADGERWRFARIPGREELEQTLAAFGVVVLPLPGGAFEHNAAIHGLDANGRLARIDDLGAGERMLSWAAQHRASD